MKLAYSPASPYVRKCHAVAIKRGIEAKVELWKIGTAEPALAAVNPLSKIPTLVTDDGMVLYDSPVICEYLDSIGDAPRVFPAEGPARWKAITLAALGDGILDATQPRRREVALPQDEGRKSYIELQQGKVARALDALEAQADSLGMLDTIGEITVGCALGYLDFRFPEVDWRTPYPNLHRLYDRLMQRQSFIDTRPS